MNKTGKRFVALVIVFTSIVSFLPIKFGLNGQAVEAITPTTTIKVSGEALDTESGNPITVTNGEYCTNGRYKSFTLAVDYKIVDDENNIPIGDTGVTYQEVIINSIDGIDISNLSTTAAAVKLDTIGCSISGGTTTYIDDSGNKTIGVTIKGLPYGVNKIEYQVLEKTKFNKGKSVTTSTTDPVTKVTTESTKIENDLQAERSTYFPSKETSKEIVIQHANKFVQTKINPMVFNSYIGDMHTYNEGDTSNEPTFLYSERQAEDKNCPLRYTFKLSDAVSTLNYVMHFDITVPINNATKVFKNGVEDTTITKENGVVSGFLTDLKGGSDLIVVKLNDDTNTTLSKAYSIQLNYATVNAEDDYTLRNAGITKLKYNSDSSYKAYVGKKFTVATDSNSTVPVYSGSITIDEMADKISMEPALGKSSSDVAFKITNHYGTDGIEDSELLDNGSGAKQYVNFHKGSVNNEIWLEVYEGKSGNITGKLLAIYKFKVTLTNTINSSTVNFTFDNSTTLTQPGRDKTTDAILFNADRRSYDLYNDLNSVTVTLDNPTTTGELGERREYIRAWGSTSVDGDNATEITNLGQNPTATIDVSSYKKLILQAYYEDTVYVKGTDGKPIKDATSGNYTIKTQTQYPIGQKYAFYIAKNITSGTNTDTTSSDASLSNIKVSNGNIKSTDGTSGFSSTKVNYNVTVPKADTSSAITATATNSNVKDITATVVETGDEYGLTSGEAFNFLLNSSGTTNIKIVVTAQDGITSKTYNITVTNNTKSAAATLKNVVTDNGDFTFDATADPNKIRVDQAIKKLKVSPVATDSNARITVNGTKFTGSAITIDLAGSQETDMEIVVTSEDGSDSNTYNFEIYRTDSAIVDDNDNSNKTDVFYDDIDDCWVDTSKYEEWGIVKGKSVYFNNKGRQVKNQWINTKNTLYYLDSNGYKTTGWRKDIGGKSYYLDPTTGALKTGWININNKWYYLGKNGVMQKGWLSSNGKWYYFTPEGVMVVNQSMFVDDKVYNFGQDGAIY